MDRLVQGAWLEKQLGAADLRILDCTVSRELLPQGARGYRSGRAAWAQGHIPGSGHVDLVEELSDLSSGLPFMLPPAEQFSDVMSRHGIGDGSRVVVYDSFMNVWAARVWWMLRAFGFDKAAVLDGGWQAWIVDGRPSTTDPEPSHASVRFVARPRPGLFVGKEEVLAAIDQRHVRIVDALVPEVYRGHRQDYPRAGHIPGARNVPFTELVDPRSHRFFPKDRLRAVVSDVLSADPERVITYCGGAIAASSDAFVLSLLGVKNVAIYDGSMSEWAADPSLPLVCED
jgi:thiosulfate/3-mercaptopyruvate sulfurtransferase